MVTFFQARKAERFFRQFRELSLEYWGVVDNNQYGERNDDAPQLREKVNKMSPVAIYYSKLLGIQAGIAEYPAPAIGGPIIRSNIFAHVGDRRLGRSMVQAREIVERIDNCIGMAQSIKERLFWRQAVNPLWYLIQFIAYIIRLPFVVLETAGLPASVEEQLWAHVVKAIILFIVLGLCTYYGLKVTIGDILKLFR